MLRRSTNLCLALAVAALTATSVAAQDSVAGEWIFSVTSPQGIIDVDFVFQQNGDEVTGSASMPDMPEVEGAMLSEGIYEDGILFFVMHVSVQGQWFEVEMEADVDGDEMVGEAYMAEMGAAPFTAKRKASD